jgi:hypothetical protein
MAIGIASFGGASNVCDAQIYKNLLVWYAAEKVAYELIELESSIGKMQEAAFSN